MNQGRGSTADEALSVAESYFLLSETGSAVIDAPADFVSHGAKPLVLEEPIAAWHPDSFGLAVSALIEARASGYACSVLKTASGASAVVEIFDVRPAIDGFLVTLQATEESFVPVAETVEPVPARMIRGRLDASGRTVEVSQHTREILGWEPEHYLTTPSIDRMHPDDRDRAMASFAELLGRPGGQTRMRARGKHRDGTWRWLEVTHTNLLHTGDPHIAAEMLDISAEMAVQNELLQREELLASLTAALPIGVMHLDSAGQADITNDAWALLTGVDASIESFLGVIEQREVARRSIDVAQETGRAVDLDIEFTDKLRSCRHAHLRICPLPGSQGGRALLLTLADTTETVMVQAKLESFARRDHLTGVLNRFGLEEHLTAALSTLTHSSPSLVVLYCDLNNFKVINDTYGHSVGDSVLAAVANRINDQVDSEGVVGRLGGDEFVAVLSAATNEHTASVADAIRYELTALAEKFDQPVKLGVSIGSAVAQPGDTFSTLVGRADTAMYEAKAAAEA